MELENACERMADLIRKADHVVVFTGAGISTSSGLPDYRGENGIRKRRRRNSSERAPIDFKSLVPTCTHMAIVELVRRGFVQHVVSQNIDNLHLKSGLNLEHLTELHGNAAWAQCDTCAKIYKNDFPTQGHCTEPSCPSQRYHHQANQKNGTSRRVTRHGHGRLKRFVVGFGSSLNWGSETRQHCQRATVALILGTSLKVEPFSSLATQHAPHVCIVNLQDTSRKLDQKAKKDGVRIHADCDVVLTCLMKKLMDSEEYNIPVWTSKENPVEYFEPPLENNEELLRALAGQV